MKLWLHAASMAVALVVAGCGGGGGGGGNGNGNGNGNGGGGTNYPLKITVAQNPVTASVPQVDLPGFVTIDATVTGTTSASTIYVVIVDSAGTFGGTPNVSQSGASQYQATLSIVDTLTMGAHPGNLQISLCGDQNCNTVLGRTTVPYTVTVAENPVLTGSFVQSSVILSLVRGDEAVTWPIRLNTPPLAIFPRAKFSDPANVLRIGGNSQTIIAHSGTDDLTLVVNPDTAPGTYTGNLEMVYCRDDACTRQYRGVTRLPYTVSVYALTNLKPLAALAGAGNWVTVQGSAAHTGFVPVTLNAANFSPRWLWRSPDPTNIRYVMEPVTAAGKVLTVAAPDATIPITPILFALDEASGAVSWQQQIPDTGTGPWNGGLGPFSPPTIAGNNVYLVRTRGTYPNPEGSVLSFRVADGVAPFAPQTFPEILADFGEIFSEITSVNTFYRPAYLTPRGGSLVMTGRVSGSQSGDVLQVALDQTTGARTSAWGSCPAARSPTRFAATVAVDANGHSFLATDSGLLLADTCETIAAAPPMSSTLAEGLGPALVPGTSGVVVVGGGNLVSFDTATKQVKWSVLRTVSDAFIGSPAIADGTVFVQNNAYGRVRLEARRETTGELLWTWQPPWNDEYSFIGNVLATNNLVFASTRRGVYAIDRTTHQAVWIYPYSGKLSMSANGVLYVRRGFTWFGDGLAAINLQ